MTGRAWGTEGAVLLADLSGQRKGRDGCLYAAPCLCTAGVVGMGTNASMTCSECRDV